MKDDKKHRLEKWEVKQGYYIDDRFCDNCDKDTKHRCKDSTHERDSSQDYQECLDCKWYLTGYDRKYHPPLRDDE